MNSTARLLTALAVDLIGLSIAIVLGADPFAFQAVSLSAACIVWIWFSTCKDETPRILLKDHWFELIALFAASIAMRSSLMAVFESAFEAHRLALTLPALAIAGVGFSVVTFAMSNAQKIKETQTFTKLQYLLLGVSILLTVLRFFYLGRIELLPEEGYYWNYGSHLAAGYIDHPPMVGILIRAGTALFGINEFGVRIFGFIISLLTAFVISALHKKIFGRTGATIAAALALQAPYVMGAGFFMSPDALLGLTWIMAVYYLYEILVEEQPDRWVRLGITVGVGLLSKYTVVLLGIPTVIFMLVDPKSRKLFGCKGPYLAAIIALGIFSPVIFWNITHEFKSFAFQSTRRVAEAKEFYLHRLILDMGLLLLPTTLFAGIVGICKTSQSRVRLFAAVFVFFPTSIFIFFSLTHETKVNWTGPGLLLLIPFAAWWLQHLERNGIETNCSQWLTASAKSIALGLLIVCCLTFQYLGFGFPLVPYGEKLHRILGWRSMTRAVIGEAQTVQVMTGDIPVIVGMDKHFISANYSFYQQVFLNGAAPYQVGSRNIVGEPSLMWDIWSPSAQFIDKTILLVAKNEADISDQRVESFFNHLDPIKTFPLETRGRKTKTYFMRVGYKYKGSTLTKEVKEDIKKGDE